MPEMLFPDAQGFSYEGIGLLGSLISRGVGSVGGCTISHCTVGVILKANPPYVHHQVLHVIESEMKLNF